MRGQPNPDPGRGFTRRLATHRVAAVTHDGVACAGLGQALSTGAHLTVPSIFRRLETQQPEQPNRLQTLEYSVSVQ